MSKKQDNRSFIERVIDEFNCFGWFDEPRDDSSTKGTNEACKKGEEPKKKARKKK